MVVSLLFPAVCAGCGRSGSSPCPACWRALRPAPPGPAPVGVDDHRSLLLYEGVARELVARLKYRNARAVLAWLASAMAALAARAWLPLHVVTWAPTTPSRRRARGFDQAELLARAVARELRVPCRRLLVRAEGEPQTGKPARERGDGVVFLALQQRAPPGPAVRILVVDDICTTGATLAAAAAALRSLSSPDGAAPTAAQLAVMTLTAARTPLKLRGPDADP